MPLLHLVFLAALQGIAETLPLSRSAHTTLARIWLDEAGGALALESTLHIGTALALVTAAHRRLLAALSEGVRAIARPALFRRSPAAHDAAVLVIATATSLCVMRFIAHHAELWHDTPLATGVGVLITALVVGSTWFAPPPRLESPSLPGALLVGLIHGAALFPGASPSGAALSLLLWLGVRPSYAIDLSLLLTVPALLFAFARGRGGLAAGLPLGAVVLSLLLVFVAALVASEALRVLAFKRRLGTLAIWLVPLGLAMIAYAHALPHPY